MLKMTKWQNAKQKRRLSPKNRPPAPGKIRSVNIWPRKAQGCDLNLSELFWLNWFWVLRNNNVLGKIWCQNYDGGGKIEFLVKPGAIVVKIKTMMMITTTLSRRRWISGCGYLRAEIGARLDMRILKTLMTLKVEMLDIWSRKSRAGLIASEGGSDVSGLWATRDNLPLIVGRMTMVMIMKTLPP